MSPARCIRIAHPCKYRPCGTRTPCSSISLAGFPRCQPCLDRLFWVTPMVPRPVVTAHTWVVFVAQWSLIGLSRPHGGVFRLFRSPTSRLFAHPSRTPSYTRLSRLIFCPLSGRFCDPLYESGKPLEKPRKKPLSHPIKTHTHPSHTTNTPNKTPLNPRPPTRQSYGTPPLHPSKHVDFHKSGLSGGGSSRRSR